MAPKENDLIDRSKKGRNWAGALTFVGGRALDPFLQYNILSNGRATTPITWLKGGVLPRGPPLITNIPFLDNAVGLSPYRSILLGMSVTSMLKQNFWVLFIGREEMSAQPAALVGVLNAVFNSLNSLFFVCAQTSASVNGEHFPQTPLLVGCALFGTGIFLEWVSEVQRSAFKSKPENQGKLYAGGLFSLSRHINYFGYTLWRAGYALAAGGWVWGGLVGGLFAYDFTNRAIPVLQKYSEEKVSLFSCSALPYGVCHQENTLARKR